MRTCRSEFIPKGCRYLRFGYRLTLLLLLWFALSGNAHALPPKPAEAAVSRYRYRILPLGHWNGYRVEAVVAMEHFETGEYQVFIRYRLWQGNTKILTNILDARKSFYDVLHIGAYDFFKTGHKQLFVSARFGGVCTHIYELSGTDLRPIYTNEIGRVDVYPVRNRAGGNNLREEWPRLQWGDEDNLGKGRYDRRTNCVSRILRWDGSTFVPLHPGPSTRFPED